MQISSSFRRSRVAVAIVVACGLAHRCRVNLCYAIGKAEPVAFQIETFGTETISKHILAQAVKACFPLSPAWMIGLLQLRRPIYAATAAYGHFTNPNYPWERLGRCDALFAGVQKMQEHDLN